MNWIVKNFLRGLVIILPIAITIYLFYQAFLRLDRLLPLRVPGTGLAILVALTILVGALASNFFVRKFLELTQLLFTRAPIVRLIYASIRDLLEAFVGDQKRFNQPVAVSLMDGVRTIGFMTQDDLAFLAMPGHVAVYMPFSYSMAGTLVIVPSSRVERLPADSASVMALVISGGVSRVTA
ncbi:MAG TPA: DUF502 domain-containing protein [Thermoanaerobaculia bacterium]|nr:DUF502 domain-containing protein [Thermoanaerobaculia bacterium]